MFTFQMKVACMMKKLLLSLFVFALFTDSAFAAMNHIMEMKMYRIKEPLQISGEDGGYYFLPIGTVLYLQTSFDEGHNLYWTPFYHKGNIEAEEIKREPKHGGRLVMPLWLNNLDENQIKDLVARFPLTKSDVKAAIKANDITKDDLLDIIRSMP